MKAFELFGHGDRWYDRVGRRNLNPKEFAMVLIVVVVIVMAWQLFG